MAAAVEQGKQAAADVPAAELEPQEQPDDDPLATTEAREALWECLIDGKRPRPGAATAA